MIRARVVWGAAAILLVLTACGGGGGPTGGVPSGTLRQDYPDGTPSEFLSTPRFTRSQPVLQKIGAQYAYARGLTGKGVRIGIDDSIVDYTQRAEFGDRISLTAAAGAVLSYERPYGDDPFGDIDSCRFSGSCSIRRGNSNGDSEAPNRWVQQIVRRDGWPWRDDSAFMLDEFYDQYDPFERLSRWREVPTPYGREGGHGTIVASVAAGKNLGVATGATVIPIARNLTEDQEEMAYVSQVWRSSVSSLSRANRENLDGRLAKAYRDRYAKFDIINRSFGSELFDPGSFARALDRELQWWRTYLPRTLNAELQTGTPEAGRTIFVYAAGNRSGRWSDIGGDLPRFIPELRGHSLSVVATDPRTGRLAPYSNACGDLPSDWNSVKHGRHFCLAAPGTVRGLVPVPTRPGRGTVRDNLTGTSFAAPLVSGALALLMEHFRETRGNTAIVRRMIDTANRSGQYGDLLTYGAGHLDLEAALTPVGTLAAGPSSHPLNRSSLSAPAAYGSIARRAAHLELAVFDDHDFPFWVPVSALISDPVAGRSPIPRFEDAEIPPAPAPGLDTLNLQWTTIDTAPAGAELLREAGWVAGFGPSSASVARRPPSGGWGYGLSFEKGSHLGSRASGAFRTNVQAGMVWTSHSFTHALSSRVSVRAAGTLAVNLPHYGADAMFRTGPSLLSAAEMRIGTPTTGIIFAQPLRAESGVGRFRLENGWMEGGRKLRDEHLVPLRPEAREFRLTVRHERQALDGTVAVEAGGAVNAGHVPGEREASIGLAYRMTW